MLRRSFFAPLSFVHAERSGKARLIYIADYRETSRQRTVLSLRSALPPQGPPLRPQQSPQDVHEILGCPNARLRMAFAKADSVVNDSRNFIADAPFGREVMRELYIVSCVQPYSIVDVEIMIFSLRCKLSPRGPKDNFPPSVMSRTWTRLGRRRMEASRLRRVTACRDDSVAAYY